jgi:ribose 5-phosphate isomerase A
LIVVDESKLSRQLGERWPVPVEVLAFGCESTRRQLEALGRVTLRRQGDAPFVTDSGNRIFDLSVGAIGDPAALDRDISSLPGVVQTGLFVGRADRVLVAGAAGVVELLRGASPDAA